MRYKILFVNLFPEIGGAETSLIYLLGALNKKIFDPIVIVPKKGKFSQRLKEAKVKVIFLNLPGFSIRPLFMPGANLVAIWKFCNLCKKLKPDVIHLTNITQAIYAGVASRLLKIPVVAISWMNMDTIYFYQDLIYNWSVDKILAVTPKLAKRLTRRKIIKAAKVEVATPGVDTEFFKPVNHKNGSHLNITVASRFDPVKDHLTFFKAMKIVIKTIRNVKIIVAQDPKINLEEKNTSAPMIKAQINICLSKNPELAKKVFFTGYLKDMRPIYAKTDILVSSSLYESLGMIHMEASSSGIPIVSTNFDGQYLVVKDGKSGFLVPVKSPKMLAKKILFLEKNKFLREKFGKEARLHILKNFSIEDYATQVEKVYLSLCKPKGRLE